MYKFHDPRSWSFPKSLIPLIEETLTNSVQNEGEADDKKAIYRATVGSFLG